MSIEEIESAVEALSAEELARFRAWFVEYDWAAWDQQIERDASAGKLADLAEQARELRSPAAGERQGRYAADMKF